jgi:PB1 domain
MSELPNNIPTTLEFDIDQDNSSTLGDERGASKMLSPEDASFALGTSSFMFKVNCPSGDTHRIRCGPCISELLDMITAKVDIPRERIRIEYEDDEGDTVVVTSDHDVIEAYDQARRAGKTLAKLTVVESKGRSMSPAIILGGGATVVALIGVAFFLLRPAKPAKK